MAITETHWKTADGLKIHALESRPEGDVKGLVLFVHGMGEYINRYASIMGSLAQKGIASLGMDHRGHGQSEGKKGHVPDYETFMKDLDSLVEEGKKRFGEVPVIMYGHSLGGNLASNYLIRRKPAFAGAVISSPWIRLTEPAPAVKAFLGKIMNSIYPSLTMPTGLDPATISRDPKEVKAYADDPKIHDLISARLFECVTEAGEYAIQNAAKIDIPVFHSHGTKDPITSFEGSKVFHQNITADKVFHPVDGGFHELHNDLGKEAYLKAVLDWIESKF